MDRRKCRFCMIPFLMPFFMLHFAGVSAQNDRGLEAQMLGLMPGHGEPGECRFVSEPRFYRPDNLWEYIDGEAEQYLLYGFRKVITADYAVGSDSNSVTVEVYCMESPTHAFGIYAAERSPEERPVDVGVQGYQGANVLNFYKGPFYVKLTAFVLSEELKVALGQMARSIADKIPGEYKEPEFFRYFPDRNRVKWSERYIPNDFLGQSYLRNGYRCDYAGDHGTYQVFLVPLESDSAAQTALKSYRLFLESQEFSILPQLDGHSLTAEKGRFILAFIYRSFFGGVLDIEDRMQGRSVVETMKKNLQSR